MSITTGKISPHLNASYKWNGSSVLAGNPATGQSWALIPRASAADVYRAVQAAHRAFERVGFAARNLRFERRLRTLNP